ncbi:hypothetical protein ACLEX4_15460 [Pseudescherichia vulneris]
MTNNKLTGERVVDYAENGVGHGYDRSHIQKLARRLLTAEEALQEYRKAKSAGFIQGKGTGTDEFIFKAHYGMNVNVGDRLFAVAQPAPAVEVAPETVPDELRDEIIELCDGYEIGDVGAQEIWSACRAAMFATTPKTE